MIDSSAVRRTLLVLCLTTAACASRPALRGSGTPDRPEIPPSAYEHYIRGRIAAERGDHELALIELRMASASADRPLELRVAIGEALMAAGRADEARREAEILCRDSPRAAVAWRLLGRANVALGNPRGAVLPFERAADLDPDDENVWLMLGAIRRQLGDEPRATEAYRQLVARVPASAEGRFRLGRSLAAAGDTDDARVELERAIELDPDHIDARVVLADLDRRDGRPRDAVATLRAAFERSGADASVGERLFQVLLEGGDQSGAGELLRKIDTEGRSPSVRLRLGLLFLQLRMSGDALRIARSLLDRDSGEHAARILEARALAQSGRRADAIALLATVPVASHVYVEARVFAAELHGREGTPHEGLVVLEPALAEFPDDTALLAAAAALEEQLGSVAKARALLDAALERAPGDEALIYARATLEDRARKPELAVTIMKRLLDRDADNVTALNFIGYSYADRGVELEAAERLLGRAAELRPDDAFILDSLGWLWLRRGELDRAGTFLERAGRLAPFEPEILLHLGELHLRRGEDARARDLFRSALGLDPAGRVRERLEERVRTLEAKRP